MYSNNILNCQVSTTTLNACKKKSWNLLNAPRSTTYRKKISWVWHQTACGIHHTIQISVSWNLESVVYIFYVINPKPTLPWSYNYTNKLVIMYLPSTEQSIKRCTCVNKRENSGSKWMLEINITRSPGGSSQLETGCRSENQLQTEGFGPLVTFGWATQAKMRKKCCYGREMHLGHYSSPSLSPFISHTQ